MQTFKTDWILFGAVLALVLFGLLIVYSASSIMARLDARYNSSWYFAIRQAGYAVVAVVVMMALKRTHYRKFQSPAVAFSAIGVALMLLFAVYFVDAAHHRWLRLGGPVGVQPSELAKPALVIFLAFFVTWRARAINNARHTLVPAALAVGFLIFAVVVPDLGTAVVLGVAAMVVFFVAGLQLRYCGIVAAVALLGLVVSIFAEPYRLGRVIRFCDPTFQYVSRIDPHGWLKARSERTLRTRDTNYQLEQSQIAVGAGGVSGVGLMNGRQKLLYLPEAHTDFIYAVAGEEMGLIGAAGLLAGFLVILWRGLRTARRIPDDFGRYLALGVTVVIVVQGFINMSVVLGIMPTKGIPLPMISYGGSSLVSTLALLGILMNVSEHAG
ncbi:MAG TPA: putative peptidoglycan glycosyltransferase FtsW [Bryobacteraceae bacterium]|jgi:cell division protein FtsW